MKFFIKEKEGRNEVQIFLRFSWGGKTTSFFTGQKIPSSDLWNRKTNSVKASKDFPFSAEVNKRLILFRSKIETAITELSYLKIEVTGEAIRAHLDNEKEKVRKDTTTLFEALTEYIAEGKQDKRKNTYNSYITLRNHLYQFNSRLTFDNLNELQLNKFKRYLQTEHINKTRLNWTTKKSTPPRVHSVGISNSTLQTDLKILKSFLTWSAEKGYNANKNFTETIKAKYKDLSHYVLTNEEIKHLQILEVPAELQNVLDLYNFGSQVGFRFIDLQTLKPAEINLVNKTVKKQITKTGDYIDVPLSPFALSIVEKYGKELPKVDLVRFNSNLKKIGELAGLGYDVQLSRIKNNTPQDNIKQAYEFMSSHQMRRNFINMLLRNGVEATTVMQLSGHKDFSSFRKYVKFNSEDLNKAINKGTQL